MGESYMEEHGSKGDEDEGKKIWDHLFALMGDRTNADGSYDLEGFIDALKQELEGKWSDEEVGEVIEYLRGSPAFDQKTIGDRLMELYQKWMEEHTP